MFYKKISTNVLDTETLLQASLSIQGLGAVTLRLFSLSQCYLSERGLSRAKLLSQPSWALANNPCNWSLRTCLLQTKKTSQKELSWPNLWGVWAEVPIQSCGAQSGLFVKLKYNKRVSRGLKHTEVISGDTPNKNQS